MRVARGSLSDPLSARYLEARRADPTAAEAVIEISTADPGPAPAHDSAPTLSVVVPCHNEEDNIGPLVRRLASVLEGLGTLFEIVLVDDGSTDATLAHIEAERARDSRVRFLALSRNFGHEAASTAGLAHARGRAVVLMDADLQDPPEVLPEMVERWREGYEIVYGRRRTRAGEPLFKRATSALFYRMMGRLVSFSFPADTGDFRLMSRNVVDALLRMPERNRFVRGMVAWTGFPSTAVVYDRDSRHAGETKYSVWRLVVLAMDAVTAFSAFPLRVVSLAGLAVTLLSMIAAAVVVFQKLFLGIAIPGYAFLATGVFFLGGMQILLLGSIGEYVGRIYTETQGRPLYLIRRAGGMGEVSGVREDEA